MAYSVEITDGSSTYTFAVTRAPEWSIASKAEYDTSKYPAELTRQVDTLTLKNCSYRDSTPANVYGNWTTIKTLLFERVTPITSIVLKDGGSTVEQITTATHHQIMVESLDPDPSFAFLASHWLGTIVIKAVALKATAANIVRKLRKLTHSFDAHGFETRTLDVEIETLPGTSAETKVIAEVLELPTTKWRYLTKSDDGIDTTLTEDSEDTHCTGRCVIQEQALAFPNSTNEYEISVETSESGSEKEVSYTIVAQADTLARAIAVAKQAPAPSAYTKKVTREERHKNRVTTTFVVRDEDTTYRIKEWALTFAGGGRELQAVRYPSRGAKRRPIPFRSPADMYVITETVAVTKRGDPNIEVPTAFTSDESWDPGVDAEPVRQTERGSVAAQDMWERRVTRTHKFFGAPPAPATLLARMMARPAAKTSKQFAIEAVEARRGR